MAKLQQVKQWHRSQQDETKRCAIRCEHLSNKVDEMNAAMQAITQASFSLQSVEDGRSILLNGRKHWLDDNNALDLLELRPEMEKTLQRAELAVMHADETHLKATIKFIREYKAALKIQTQVRRFTKRSWYLRTMIMRHKAATFLQEKYQQRLYYIALRLPEWCVVGGEVMIAKSVARKAGTIDFMNMFSNTA